MFFRNFWEMVQPTEKITIDINADLGEGSAQDAHIMPLITSCNIACGGHYGTEETMRETIRLAKANQVKIGAHPSFPDTDNFGRKRLTMTKQELTETVFSQLLHFFVLAEDESVPVHHIKLHGALYNYAAADAPTADAVVDAMVATKIRPKLYVPYGSVLHRKAENLLPLVFEAFLDRSYMATGALVPREQPGALIDSPEAMWQQFRQIVLHGTATAINGATVRIKASTFCIHGDNPQSVAMLNYLHRKLAEAPIAFEQ